MHGLCEVHEPNKDNCLPSRTVLSTLNTPIYNLWIWLVSVLKLLTINVVTAEHSFHLAEEIIDQQAGFFMESKMLISSSITMIPLNETTEIYSKKFFEEPETVDRIFHPSLSKICFLFLIKETLYKQTDCLVMVWSISLF